MMKRGLAGIDQALSAGLSLLISLYLAKQLGADQFAQVASLQSVLMIGMLIHQSIIVEPNLRELYSSKNIASRGYGRYFCMCQIVSIGTTLLTLLLMSLQGTTKLSLCIATIASMFFNASYSNRMMLLSLNNFRQSLTVSIAGVSILLTAIALAGRYVVDTETSLLLISLCYAPATFMYCWNFRMHLGSLKELFFEAFSNLRSNLASTIIIVTSKWVIIYGMPVIGLMSYSRIDLASFRKSQLLILPAMHLIGSFTPSFISRMVKVGSTAELSRGILKESSVLSIFAIVYGLLLMTLLTLVRSAQWGATLIETPINVISLVFIVISESAINPLLVGLRLLQANRKVGLAYASAAAFSFAMLGLIKYSALKWTPMDIYTIGYGFIACFLIATYIRSTRIINDPEVLSSIG